MGELRITRADERSELTTDGDVVPSKVIHFVTAKDIKGQIRIPRDFDIDQVKAAVRVEAERLDSLIGPL